jgi:hypothetical protein
MRAVYKSRAHPTLHAARPLFFFCGHPQRQQLLLPAPSCALRAASIHPTIPWSLLPNRSPAAALTPTTVLGQPIAVGITS